MQREEGARVEVRDVVLFCRWKEVLANAWGCGRSGLDKGVCDGHGGGEGRLGRIGKGLIPGKAMVTSLLKEVKERCNEPAMCRVAQSVSGDRGAWAAALPPRWASAGR